MKQAAFDRQSSETAHRELMPIEIAHAEQIRLFPKLLIPNWPPR